MFWLLELLTSLPLFYVRRGITRDRGTLEYIAARHPRSTVRRARLTRSDWAEEQTLQSIEFVVADRRGLSFRDSWGHEELKVGAREIGSIEVIDDPKWAGQHLRVLNREGTAYREVWAPENAGDVRTALVDAIARSPLRPAAG